MNVIYRLKCQLSGDALQGSWSQLNVIKLHDSLSLLIQIPYPLKMFALARKMGYEMRPIARWLDNTLQPSGPPRVPFTPGQGYRPPFRPSRDFSRIKCFSCSQFGHTQARCPKPDSSLPYKPADVLTTSEHRSTAGKLYLDRDLTHTGLNAIHQGSISSSLRDHTLRNSTRNSDIIDTTLKN